MPHEEFKTNGTEPASMQQGISSEPKKKSGMTRRQMIAVTAAGAAITVPGIAAIYRWGSTKKLEITLKGPFENYGYFKPEELGIEDAGEFEILFLKLNEGKYADDISIQYTFRGKETPSRQIGVSLTAFDKNGKRIAHNHQALKDPRISAKSDPTPLISKPSVSMPHAYFRLELPEGVKIDDVERIVVQVENNC